MAKENKIMKRKGKVLFYYYLFFAVKTEKLLQLNRNYEMMQNEKKYYKDLFGEYFVFGKL